MDRFEFRYVMGHVEVYDLNGGFCFSADSMVYFKRKTGRGVFG